MSINKYYYQDGNLIVDYEMSYCFNIAFCAFMDEYYETR